MQARHEITDAAITALARRLKLPVFARYHDITDNMDPLSTTGERLRALLEAEAARRDAAALRLRLRAAGFPCTKTLADFESSRLGSMAQQSIADLSSCAFVSAGRNIIMLGGPGTGKTHLAIALGRCGCAAGIRVLFRRISALSAELREAEAAGELPRRLRQLQKPGLLILDELGYVPLSEHSCELLFEAVAGRGESGSIILTTSLPFERWGEVMQGRHQLEPLVDRLTYHALLLDMSGPSYRLDAAKRGC